MGLAAALLGQASTLVPRWLPHGEERNGRWYIGDFDGNPGESANVNLLTGQWIDNGAPDEDVGGDLISLYARIRGLRNSEAARELIVELRWERDFLRGSSKTGASPPVVDDDGVIQDDNKPPAAVPTGKNISRWESVLPVPKHAPVPQKFRHGFKNKATDEWVEFEAVRVWEWVFEGERFGYTCRFERVNSAGEFVKDILPLTWCRDTEDPRGGHRWHWKQWPTPRPLYVPATLLAGDPSALPVVVVEGEKCAQAGHQLLGHEFDFVTWPGGSKAWNLARWSWLMGRHVILWPDADAQRRRLTKDEREAGVDPLSKPVMDLAKQPGYQAMVGIGLHLQAEHGCTVSMVHMMQPGDRPDGWDLADAIDQGWTANDVRAYLRAAHAFRGPDDAPRAAAGIGGESTPSKAAARQGLGAAAQAEAEKGWTWVRYLLRAEKTDAVKAVRENIIIALDGRPERGVSGIDECVGLIRFNEFSNTVEKSRPAPWGSPAGEWLEADELLMGDWLVREHYMPSMARQALEEAVLVVARRHSYHPLRDRVQGLRGTWDGEPRLDMWLQRVCLENDEHSQALQDYIRFAGRWFVMAMCARVMDEKRAGTRVIVGPGCKFDYMLILEGPQGWGKSTFAAALGGEYFADTGLDIQHKDSLMNIQGIWVYEWSELENLTKQEVGAVKRFVSSPVDRFRATFDRRPAKYPRQVVFVGTTNEAHYLTDTTGNRRFWPVRVTRPPDVEWLRENLDQLLAEAVAAVDAGERFYPTRDEQRDLFDPQQRQRTVESSLEGAIRAYLYDSHQRVPLGGVNGSTVQQITLQDLLSRCGYTIDKQTDAVAKKAGALMHMLGWETKRLSADEEGRRPRVYVRPRPKPQKIDSAPLAKTGASDISISTGSTQNLLTPEADDAPPF